ncbi:MAG: hypothetical protein AVDCRST_MAG37-3257 [uncultured Rubrobacteraceae bacterium]|uniref:Uncharacterized protein n=1 Tax=uncultured Rubrobacteraceae bacterium TaxID=349277 RepID=A0A6J4QWV3_9ACTN|nr:MAG: hypothetical protein AVDCRST_MAG37-3257 [uncultured Rubrobacteraceae bacterium]
MRRREVVSNGKGLTTRGSVLYDSSSVMHRSAGGRLRDEQ